MTPQSVFAATQSDSTKIADGVFKLDCDTTILTISKSGFPFGINGGNNDASPSLFSGLTGLSKILLYKRKGSSCESAALAARTDQIMINVSFDRWSMEILPSWLHSSMVHE